jgi:hypothetical protein
VSTPRINWVFFILFLLAAIGVFAGALIFPPFRKIAYGPVRELVLPPPAPMVVSVSYSTEKEAWLDDVVANFEMKFPKSGTPSIRDSYPSGSSLKV